MPPGPWSHLSLQLMTWQLSPCKHEVACLTAGGQSICAGNLTAGSFDAVAWLIRSMTVWRSLGRADVTCLALGPQLISSWRCVHED